VARGGGRGPASRPGAYGYGEGYPGPREARGGIKAQTRRGAFGRSWWARRWIEVVEGFHVGARLSRGRSYARQGQVLSVEVDRGAIRARVQGSRVRPYEVTIRVRTLTPGEWQRVLRSLGAEALFAAKLVAGQVPPEVENLFARTGLSLFPQRLRDVETSCSCPDWSNPCKHVAAVFYLVAEELDRDPFLLFRLRGLDREELLAALGGLRAEDPGGDPGSGEPEGVPLPTDPAAFWRGAGPADAPGAPSEDLAESGGHRGAGGPPRREGPDSVAPPGDGQYGAVAPPVAPALAKRLGRLPFWRGSVPFPEALEGVCAAASELALGLLAGGGPDPGEAEDVGPPSGEGRGRSVAPRASGGSADARAPRRAGGGDGRDGRRTAAAGGKSRDRAALEADLRAGVPWEVLRARYDGRILRPFRARAAEVGRREPPARRFGRRRRDPPSRPNG
jgi:uncharacterized Zn finger protein